MKKIGMVLLSFGLFVLVGCEEETKSVDWWYKNQEKAKIKVQECKDSGLDTQNCKNAKKGKFLYDQENAPIPTFGDLGKETKKYEEWYSKHPDETYNDYKKCHETNEISEKCDAAFYMATEFSDSKKHPETSERFQSLLK
ncbi:EexN family lipoprotein [Sodalis endosymbiont of Spalangia cameroni]|uniref:EexN family lipoprotein n=1 Tax=Enterobacterales TaxID=91347 RepID=UPI0031F8B3C9